MEKPKKKITVQNRSHSKETNKNTKFQQRERKDPHWIKEGTFKIICSCKSPPLLNKETHPQNKQA